VRVLGSGEQSRVELAAEVGELRDVAPILAREECLKCHEGEVGAMLGAFDDHLRQFGWRKGSELGRF
jgi:hypothetical protein